MHKWLMLAAALAAAPALAQDASAKSGSNEKAARGAAKAQSIDFEEDTIEGDLTRPDGEYVEARSRVKHSNLIRIREDFEEKVMESVGEL